MRENGSSGGGEVGRRMARVGRSSTAAELAVRRALFSRGLRYRVQVPVPGLSRRSIDIAFPRARIAVFVDGCFWHSCPLHATEPKSNAKWWQDKLERNRVRDSETTLHLKALGWRVVRVWEHERADDVADQVARMLLEHEVPTLEPPRDELPRDR